VGLGGGGNVPRPSFARSRLVDTGADGQFEETTARCPSSCAAESGRRKLAQAFRGGVGTRPWPETAHDQGPGIGSGFLGAKPSAVGSLFRWEVEVAPAEKALS